MIEQTDDILTGGKTVRECQENTDEVFRRISRMEMTVNKKKCVLVAPQITFYGMVISKYGIKNQ